MGRELLSLRFLRGELEIDDSEYRRADSNNSQIERMMKNE